MNTKGLRRKLAAILITDVVEYSRLMREDEETTVRTVTAYRQVISALVEKHHGRVVDSPGDNLLAEFASALDAVQCAVGIQEEIAERNARMFDGIKMQYRIGINLGDVLQEDERIYGDGVNIAARIEGLAQAGGICISKNVYDQVKNKLSLRLVYAGEHAVKNILEPVQIYRIIVDVEAPVSETGEEHQLPERPSIAVLPFTNISGDPEQEYFSDGLTEDLITDLSKISGLFVIARDSVFTFKGKTAKVGDVGRELGVRYVLDGSIRKAKNRVRISVQLIDAETKGHLWAERYDRELDDIFSLQDELTQEIVTALAVRLSEDEKKRLARRGTTNIKAYDYVLRGSEYLSHYTKEANTDAQQMFQNAIDIDPEYALAYSLMSLTHLTRWILGWSRDPQSMALASGFGEKAVALDDSLAEAHLALGMVYLWKKQHKRAIESLERARNLRPNNADIYATLGNAFTWAARYEEAIEAVERAMRLNPYHPAIYYLRIGQAYGLMGQYEKAAEALKKALVRDPNLLPVHLFLAFVYHELGRKEEARGEITELLRQNPEYTQDVMRETFPLKDHERFAQILKSLRECGLPD